MASGSRIRPAWVTGYPPPRSPGSAPTGGGSGAYPPKLAPPGAPLLWFDAQDIDQQNNATLLDGATVSLWKNKGSLGSGANFVQGTVGSRPFYRRVAAAGKIQNLSAVESTGTKVLTSAAFTLQAQPLIWAVVFRNTAVGIQVICAGGGTNTNQTLTSGTGFQMYAGITQSPAPTIAANTWETLIMRYDGASSTITLNGATSSGFGSVGSFGIDQITAFWNPPNTAAADMIGMIAELIVWPAAGILTADVAAYLSAKYGATPQ